MGSPIRPRPVPITLDISHERVNRAALRQRFYSLELLKSPHAARIVAYWVTAIFGITVVAMFLPWQQFIWGTGQVTALRPEDRPQEVPSVIAGRIEKWYVSEGQLVSKGQPLVQISEVKDKYFDPQTANLTREQAEQKAEEAQAKRSQIVQLEAALRLKLEQSRNKITQAEYKVAIDSANLRNDQVQLQIAERQYAGRKELFDKGLLSLVQFEGARSKLQETSAKVESARNKLDGSINELLNARIEVNSVQADYREKIAKAKSDLASTLGSLAKLQNEATNIEIRAGFYTVRAPLDGYIVRALKQGLGEQVKENEALLTIVPRDPHMAVELYVRATDVPLLSVGRQVRLQFDGWPALQFAGWPSVMVGTFGGTIRVVDIASSKGGTYRVLVVPDTTQEPWPKATQLRMGSGVQGWAMLNEVPVWFEVWRQLNSFPPSIAAPADGSHAPQENNNGASKKKDDSPKDEAPDADGK
jgi:adhesin transport system membrane fusion protein